MGLILSEINQIEEFFYTEIQKDFPPELVVLRDRVRIITDTQQFKDLDEDIWKQKQNLKSKYYQVYFDNEFICGFDSTFPPEGIKLLFFRNLLQLTKQDKVYLNSNMKKFADDKEKEQKKVNEFKNEVEILKIDNPTTREIVKSLNKRNATAKKTHKSRT